MYGKVCNISRQSREGRESAILNANYSKGEQVQYHSKGIILAGNKSFAVNANNNGLSPNFSCWQNQPRVCPSSTRLVKPRASQRHRITHTHKLIYIAGRTWKHAVCSETAGRVQEKTTWNVPTWHNPSWCLKRVLPILEAESSVQWYQTFQDIQQSIALTSSVSEGYRRPQFQTPEPASKAPNVV